MTVRRNREEQLEVLKRLDAREIRQITDMRELHADDVVLLYKKTGVRVFLLLADDPSKVFTTGFRTPPQGSTGAVHIIEHTVLYGSKKYRTKDPFMELVKNLLNTFLNAMTYPDRTFYPVASCNPKDFEDLMDIYLGVVLHSLFYKKEKIFRQEGRKYELGNEDGKLSRNGIVCNEMKDVHPDLDGAMACVVGEALFPGYSYAEGSGGDPGLIPDLIYEAYLDSHRRYYYPNSAFIYLYDDLDMAERLCYLDENYLSRYGRLAINSAIPAPRPLIVSILVSRPYSISGAESEENAVHVSLSICIGGQLEPVPYNVFQALDYVPLKVPSAIPHDRLTEEGFGGDVYGGYTNGIRGPYFRITVKYSRHKQKDAFMHHVRELLTGLAEDDLDYEMLLTAINITEFRAHEANSGSHSKSLIYGLQSLESWIYDGDPCLYLKFTGLFDALHSKMGDNYLEELIREKLLDNKKYAAMELYPVCDLTTKHETEDTEELLVIRAVVTTEKREALIHFGREMGAYQDTLDNEAALRAIPMLSREDFAAENTPLCYETETPDETLFYYAAWNTIGINYPRLDFDVSDLPVEDFLALMLIKDPFGYLSAEVHSHTELSILVNLHTGGIQLGIDNYPDLAGFRGDQRIFSASVESLAEKMEQVLNLVNEQLLQMLFTDEARIHNLVGKIRAGLKDTLLSARDIAAASRAAPCFNENGFFRGVTRDIAHYRFLGSFLAEFAHCAFCERAPKLLREIAVRDRLLVRLIMGEADKEVLLSLLRTFGGRYPVGGKGEVRFRPTGDIRRRGFRPVSRVNYVARVGSLRTGGFRYTDMLRIAQTILSYGYLWNEIRSKGGAYDYSVRFGRGGNVVFSSYRDPKFEAADRAYEGTLAYFEYYETDERETAKAITSAIGEMDTPRGVQMSGQLALATYYSEVTDEVLLVERKEMLTATPADIRAFASLVRETLCYETKCAIGNESTIERAEGFFTGTPQFSAKESEETEI